MQGKNEEYINSLDLTIWRKDNVIQGRGNLRILLKQRRNSGCRKPSLSRSSDTFLTKPLASGYNITLSKQNGLSQVFVVVGLHKTTEINTFKVQVEYLPTFRFCAESLITNVNHPRLCLSIFSNYPPPPPLQFLKPYNTKGIKVKHSYSIIGSWFN